MLDESMNTSQSPSASPLDKPPTADVDRKLTDLLTQTNQLLQIIINLLQKQGTIEVSAEKPVFSSENWLDEWTKVVNSAFESSMERIHGATEALAFARKLNFSASDVRFDAALKMD